MGLIAQRWSVVVATAWAEGIEQGHTDSWEEAIKGWAQRASKRAGGRISREAWVVACAKVGTSVKLV